MRVLRVPVGVVGREDELVVAECLDVRLPTIKSHLLSIFGKTGATSRTDLARLMRV